MGWLIRTTLWGLKVVSFEMRVCQLIGGQAAETYCSKVTGKIEDRQWETRLSLSESNLI